jgi:glycosyltransferase involved in cell wall biosynthesis
MPCRCVFHFLARISLVGRGSIVQKEVSTLQVLHLSAGNLYGGVEKGLSTLAHVGTMISSPANEFGLCYNGTLQKELLQLGARVHDFGPTRFARPWTVWQARRRLVALLKRARFDAVLCHECWPHAVFAPTARRCRVPVVFCGHDGHSGAHWLERLASWTQPDLIVANSCWNRSALQTIFPGVLTEVVYPLVVPSDVPNRPAARQEVRARLGTPASAVVLLMAARLEPWKGHAVLIEALGPLTELPGWECWVAGGVQRPEERTYLQNLERRLSAAGLSRRVRFLGQRSDVARLMASADVYVQPNVEPEQFGRALVEAMAAGLPVITTAMGGPLEYVAPSCGFLLPPGDPVTLREHLRELIVRPELRAALGSAGPGRARAFCNPHEYMERTHTILTSLVRHAPTGLVEDSGTRS